MKVTTPLTRAEKQAALVAEHNAQNPANHASLVGGVITPSTMKVTAPLTLAEKQAALVAEHNAKNPANQASVVNGVMTPSTMKVATPLTIAEKQALATSDASVSATTKEEKVAAIAAHNAQNPANHASLVNGVITPATMKETQGTRLQAELVAAHNAQNLANHASVINGVITPSTMKVTAPLTRAEKQAALVAEHNAQNPANHASVVDGVITPSTMKVTTPLTLAEKQAALVAEHNAQNPANQASLVGGVITPSTMKVTAPLTLAEKQAALVAEHNAKNLANQASVVNGVITPLAMSIVEPELKSEEFTALEDLVAGTAYTFSSDCIVNADGGSYSESITIGDNTYASVVVNYTGDVCQDQADTISVNASIVPVYTEVASAYDAFGFTATNIVATKLSSNGDLSTLDKASTASQAATLNKLAVKVIFNGTDYEAIQTSSFDAETQTSTEGALYNLVSEL